MFGIRNLVRATSGTTTNRLAVASLFEDSVAIRIPVPAPIDYD